MKLHGSNRILKCAMGERQFLLSQKSTFLGKNHSSPLVIHEFAKKCALSGQQKLSLAKAHAISSISHTHQYFMPASPLLRHTCILHKFHLNNTNVTFFSDQESVITIGPVETYIISYINLNTFSDIPVTVSYMYINLTFLHTYPTLIQHFLNIHCTGILH